MADDFKTGHTYTDPEGYVHESYEAYCNSPDLDPDLVVIKLWKGQREPQNDYERKVLAELQEMKRKGQHFEVDFN